MLVHCRVTPIPNIKFASTHLYPWVERNTVRVIKCFTQEHNTMFDHSQDSSLNAQSRIERTVFIYLIVILVSLLQTSQQRVCPLKMPWKVLPF